MVRLCTALVVCSALTGCSLAPSHVTPPLSTPAVYPEEVSPAGSVAVTGLGWREFFRDERLQQLIALALENNRDLRVATARIQEAQGLYRIQRSDQLPKLGLSGTATREHVGSSALPPPETSAAAGASLPNGFTYNNYDIGIGVTSFELDFWGRVRDLTEAARSQYLGTIAAERAFRLSLIRDVATAYVTSRSLAEQSDQADQTVDSRERALQIAKIRLDAGVTGALDYRQTETLLTQAQTQAALLHNERAQQRNLIRLLVGAPIEEKALAAARTLRDQGLVREIDAGLPSALLLQRPDVIEAEENLRAARANVGAARAAFFPTITLTGQYGYASTSLDNLFDTPGQQWSFGPSLSLPIFDWGELRGNLDVAKARVVIQVATYEKTVQNAFREVSDALASRRYLAEQITAQARAVDANQTLATLARERYDNGVVQYLEVLDAERNLFSAKQQLIALRGDELSSLVTLYASLGGGLGAPQPSRPGDAQSPAEGSAG